MNTPSAIGTYPISVAFAIARDLEHAGISTDVTRATSKDEDRYTVNVAAENVQRALTLAW